MNELKLLNKECIKHKIIYTTSRRLVIKYDRNGVLNIRAPKGITLREIEEFIGRHMDWIYDHYEESQPKTRSYKEFEEYLYLGKKYHLRIVSSRHEGVFLQNDEIIIYTLKEENVKKLLLKWRKEQAEVVFEELLFQAFKHMEKDLKAFPKMQIKKYLSRWGCCYPKRNQIILNISLIHVPIKLINYVIYHELAHFKYQNHQPEFHAYLRKYVPNENDLRKELKKYQADYE